jgi:replicative DNA helicase
VPVVFVDYLQILAPADPRSTDKQNTDHAVVELKRLSAAHDVPIFCISSLNRASYTEPIGPAAFKESGAIEYGSDVLLGMQVFGMDYEPGEKQTTHGGRVRKVLEAAEQADEIDIHVKVLKNRNGRRASAKMSFNKKFNTFRDVALEFTPFYGATPFDGDPEQEDIFAK